MRIKLNNVGCMYELEAKTRYRPGVDNVKVWSVIKTTHVHMIKILLRRQERDLDAETVFEPLD